MVRNELAATHYNAVERHAAQNEGQSPKRAGIFGVSRRKLSVNQSHQIYPQRGGTTHGSVSRITKFSLKRWGMGFAKRRGSARRSPLARKIGIILHRMWIDGTTYRGPKRSRS